ncbi:hypothetical protein BH23ACT10_BH23ACT10_31220 [soil metagenome]
MSRARCSASCGVRRAIDTRHRLHITYGDDESAVTERVIRPRGLFFWGRTWTVAAWCELRTDHRSFRIDRIRGANLLADTFALEPPVTLDAFRATLDREQ